MNQLPSKHDYPRPLVIVDEARIAWSLPRAEKYIKDFPSADFVFVTTAGLSSGTWRSTPEILRDKQLWLSAPSVDKTVVVEWLRNVVGRATTKRTEDEAERLVANTYNICGGHVGRIVKFLDAVLKDDGISVPLDALESDRSVCGDNGGAANAVFEHPEASKLFEEGSAAFNLEKLRLSYDELDQALLQRIRKGLFRPTGSSEPATTASVSLLDDETTWSLGSAAQRDYVTKHVPRRVLTGPIGGLKKRFASPVDVLLAALPHWPSNLLFVRDTVGDCTPFMESHVHQGFIEALRGMKVLRPGMNFQVLYEVPVQRSTGKVGKPPCLDFVISDASGERWGFEFLVDDCIEEHHARFSYAGKYAPLHLNKHLTVYFEASPERTDGVLNFLRTHADTCVVKPSEVHGWDAFDVFFWADRELSRQRVPRVGGFERMFVPRLAE
uniref:Uncharacterized protein n=1 Tax=Chromera velia CCMP2878 TaxID=1169474 RepID=A0A0G4HU93_9ALVE|eukprot:Cvel_1369.t1-p1 / transcript=Cvel_1369.t1 / gene=Cvel_1369 / organism=Chromera_velia_CCMP2878 / gene_product=hypothetical protein / transcript_product=hypothetical protein / location=Cvel_scaffold47:105158-106474(+) / protein_length=439 / sequence_SO=supercontig / SO=protein_coding / is_pseudo=false